MALRRQLIPWRAAGTRAEMRRNADEVVRDTGWVFNNQTGSSLTLDEFVKTGYDANDYDSSVKSKKTLAQIAGE